MSITPITTPCAPAALGPAAPRRADAPHTAATAPAKASEPLNLSGTAVAARALAASPPVDDAKVAGIKAALAAGTYAVDAGKIADAMIAHDLP